jgi:hypothetical protein
MEVGRRLVAMIEEEDPPEVWATVFLVVIGGTR